MPISTMLDKNQVQTDLQIAADDVEKTDEYAAERLRELAEAVGKGPHSDAWAASDIHQMINVDDIVKRYQIQTSFDTATAWIELFRNILIFAPLVITWFGISKAMSAYSDLIVADPKQSALPFILLWQQGFGHRLPEGLYFSAIAWDDVGVLATVVLLTAAATFLSSFARMKREEKARELAQRITHALAGARIWLTTKDWQQPTNFVTRFDQAIESFKLVVQGLVNQMQGEREAISVLAARQSEETRLFQQFKNDFTNSTGNMTRAIATLQESADQLSDTISSKLTRTMGAIESTADKLLEPTQELAEHQRQILDQTKESIALFSAQVRSQDEIIRQQEAWGTELRRTLNALEHTVTENASQNDTFADKVNQIQQQYLKYLEEMKQEYTTQKDITNRIFDITEHMKDTVKLIKESSNELNAINVNMDELVRRVAGLAPSKA